MATFLVPQALYATTMESPELQGAVKAGALSQAFETMRDAALSGALDDEFETLLAWILYSDNPTADEEMLRFFMRGTSGFPVVSENRAYIVLYNPVADVAVLTSWVFAGNKPHLSVARLLLGEQLQDQTPEQSEPRWMTADAPLQALARFSTAYLEITTTEPDRAAGLIRSLLDRENSKAETARSAQRVARMAIAVSDKALSCGDAMAAAGLDLRGFAALAEKTNIDVPVSEAVPIVAIGGMVDQNLDLRLYVLKSSASHAVAVAADAAQGCRIDYVTGFRTLPKSLDATKIP